MIIEIPDAHALLLALLLHRLTWDDVLRRAEDKQQCEDMLIALETLRQEIERAPAGHGEQSRGKGRTG